jgi:predicted N-acetyltransferase YhbS
MDVTMRPGRPDDATACGTICYEAFAAIARAHGFPPDFPSPDAAIGLVGWMLSHPHFVSVVAVHDGRVVGSNFLDRRNPVAGVGPITVDPAVQNAAIGRRLMSEVTRSAEQGGHSSVRLVQAAFHGRSLSLYTKLGYAVREPLACLQGSAIRRPVRGCVVRTVQEDDVEGCNVLCRGVHGHDRAGELRDAVAQGTATLVERGGRITGYATQIGFLGHAVGESNEDLQALIGAADSFLGPGFLLPMRNTELFRWCLEHGLRVVQPLTLMTRGSYQEPTGAFLPSILY